MTTTLTGLQWLELLFLGGFMGVLGQGMRTFAGLKKVNDEADLRGVTFGEVFDRSVLFTSLALGFVAGATAALTLVGTTGIDPKGYTMQVLLGFAVAGYAGSDFIEAFVKSTLPSQYKKPQNTAFRHVSYDEVQELRPALPEALRRTFQQNVIYVIARNKNMREEEISPAKTLKTYQYNRVDARTLASSITNYLNTETSTPLRTRIPPSRLNENLTVQQVVNIAGEYR